MLPFNMRACCILSYCLTNHTWPLYPYRFDRKHNNSDTRYATSETQPPFSLAIAPILLFRIHSAAFFY